MSLEKMTCGVNYTTNLLRDNVNGLIQKSTATKSLGQQLYTPFGNSITAVTNGFWLWFLASSQGNAALLRNEGVHGNTTQDMIDRIGDIPTETTLCTVMEGTNDVGTGVEPITHAENIRTILLNLLSRGITPVVLLAPPKDNQVLSDILREMNLRTWLVARRLGVMCYNPWDQFGNGYGQWLGGFSYDGTHPTSECSKIAGSTLWGMYDRGLSIYPLNTNNGTDTTPNGLFLLDSNADGKPDDANTANGSNFSLAVSPLGIGNTYSYKATNETTFFWMPLNIENGKRYSLGFKMSLDFISRIDGKTDAYIQSPSGSRTYLIDKGYESFEGLLFSNEFTADESGVWRFYVNSTGSDFECDVSIAQLTCFCITDLELQEAQ